LIPYGKHTVDWRDALAVAWQVRTKSLTQGKRIQEFEERIADYVGAKYAVAVSSATAGLHISMLALELPPESEVVTSPISFVASSNAAIYAGLTPVFIDVDSHSVNLSSDLFRNYCNRSTKLGAVIPVHFAGLPCDMAEIHKTAKKYDLGVIEDAAHALGGIYETGEKIGSCRYSDLTVFSFHAVKSITTGEGGVITTNSENFYKKLLLLRSHGISKEAVSYENQFLAKTENKVNPWYYEMQTIGYHYRLTEIQAALGVSQMKKIENFSKKRMNLVKNYKQLLINDDLIKPAQQGNNSLSGNHIFPVQIDFSKIKISKHQLVDQLMKLGIGSQIHYLPIPLHPFYRDRGYKIANLPNALNYFEGTLTLPLYPKLSFRTQKRIIKSLQKLVHLDA
jgi:perosamine synthetase